MYDLQKLLEDAVQYKASDVHLTVGKAPIFRMDGELRESGNEKLSPDQVRELLLPIIDEHHREELKQEGETDFAHAIPGTGRFRVNVYQQRGAYAAAIRILPYEIPLPDTLGLPQEVIDLSSKKRGLVLVTGPTGSGKSTTLASLIRTINEKYAKHIITLEDPIEYLHRHGKSMVNQREIGSDSRSYAHALRAALRQDPDVILVGEMRDLETISTAITAAETGHLVFSTLHTIGAEKTIDRIIDVFPPGQQQQVRIQLASVLECIISQQLLARSDTFGRVAALEVLFVNPAVRNLIREGKTFQIPSVMQTSRKIGMQTMDDALYQLCMERKIDGEQAVTFAQNSAEMERRLGVL